MFNLIVSMESLDAWLSFQSWISFFNTKKISLRAGFEVAREDPIGFRVQRLNHSAIAAGAIKLSALCSTSSFQCEPLEALLSFHSCFFWHKKVSLQAGIEPAREDSIGFRVQRHYHSAITSDAIKSSALCSTSSFQWNHLTRGFLSKAGSLSLTQKRSRCEQDSNLRGKIPLDFESNALTTRPSQLVQLS